VPATGGTPRQLTDGQWNHTGVEWTPDGTSILFTSMRVADPDHQWRETDIYAVSVATGDIRQLTRRKGSRQQSQGVARRDARGVHRLRHDERHVGRSEDLRDGHRRIEPPARIRQLTDVNGDILAGKKLGEVEEIWYAASDGLRIRAGSSSRPTSIPAAATH
jgi:hypothetical protein